MTIATDQGYSMTEDQVRRIAAEAAAQAIKETLQRLGLEVEDPLQVQRDMQHLRDWRNSMERVKSKSLLTAVGIAITGFSALLMIGLRDYLGR